MASGKFSKSFTPYDYKVRVEWSSTPTTATNSSVVTAKIYLDVTYSLYTSAHDGSTIYINGVGYPFNSPSISIGSGGTVHLATVTSNSISHNTDGKKSIDIQCDYYVSATISGTWYGIVTASKTVTLDEIPREASLTSADNFNDEGNPSISYSNPAGESITLQAAIYDAEGITAYAAYRTIPATVSNYTFNLTNNERNALRNAIPRDKSMQVRFYLKSIIGNQSYYSYISKTFNIINANPILSPSIQDINSKTLALTGSADSFIKYYSDAAITIGASAIKGATLESERAQVAGKEITSPSGTINAVESGSFTFTATDSRGNSTTTTIDKTFIDYTKLTCNFKPQVTIDGVCTLRVSGNYYSGSFGAVNNTLNVYYRYKEASGSYGAWASIPATGSYGTYEGSVSFTFPNFNYKNSYTFQVYAADKLITLDAKTYTVSALPVCDWSSQDFRFNVPIYIGNTQLTEENLIRLLQLLN